MRSRLATEAGAPDPRQRQFAVTVLVAVAAATAFGFALDLQTPALIAGLTAVFALVAAGGQALEPDLHRFAWFSPILVLVMTIGPLSRGIPVLAGLLVAVVVLGAGMLPALGEHYRIGGQTIAAATIVATTTGIGAGDPAWLLFTSAAAGAGFGLALRVVNGLTDPRRATRGAVARTLLEPGPGVLETAAAAWRADGGTVWLGQVLAGAARLRAARETLLAQAEQSDEQEADRLRRIVAETDAVAAELARAVRARACSGLPVRARRDPAEAVLLRAGRQDLPEAVQGIRDGLDRVRGAVVQRDQGQVPAPEPGARRERIADAVRAHLSLRSSLFRHALRCTLAVAVGMVVVLLLDDPSASSLLLALYLVLQPAARDSMTGALERTGAAVLGVTALALLITLLPWAFLLVPLVIAGMLLSTDRLRGDYQLLLGCLIAITVVDQALRLDRELINVGISFAANTAVGAAIALFVGFISYLVLPSSVLPDVRGSVRSAVWAVSELVRSVRLSGQIPAPSADLRAAHVLALRRTQDLLGMPALLDGTGEETDDGRSTRDAAIALDALRQNVATLAFRPQDERELAAPALTSADDLLVGKPAPRIPDVPGASAPAGELLAGSLVENALHARAAIDRTLGYDDPWKSYALSFVRPEGTRAG
ncbi:FUSC family protein [Saccharopolyspora sp. HNM0983]|uniref:FUSC family protein n=1 Tax=Saccharopolyspora montiporae TaxID=2781240 RepID=A0A929B8D7_9PSEU|nr:FUSC family protein [Saccharopolyspora sp. HNM0983]MBE9374085.1 FUSC family protein [Saccharopolyspora sp. HNM0983]